MSLRGAQGCTCVGVGGAEAHQQEVLSEEDVEGEGKSYSEFSPLAIIF